MLQSIYTHAGCDYGCLYTYSPRHCFNPHTHAGCDITSIFYYPFVHVSIHTPTQGVTAEIHTQNNSRKFQSTHPRRVWHLYSMQLSKDSRFQSTHPRRVWRHEPLLRYGRFWVSIHTPTQGVTEWITLTKETFSVSIHTPTQGVTIILRIYEYLQMFQSTHPRRVWLINSIIPDSAYLFQSTHPRRVWHDGKERPTVGAVSIHTPTQGVTQAGIWE